MILKLPDFKTIGT